MVKKSFIEKDQVFPIPKDSPPLIHNGLIKRIIRTRVKLLLFFTALRHIKSIPNAVSTLKTLKQKYQNIFGELFINKIAKNNGKYYWRLNGPGFPSLANRILIENEINKVFPFKENKGLRVLYFAITKKCPLNCEHCFEWENLDKKEKLSLEDLKNIIWKFQDYGTTQVMLSGGEPMVRFKDLVALLKSTKKGTHFWMITSGLGLSLKKARILKQAGLTGVVVSLDDYREKEHNRFRGYKNAYQNAIHAVINAKKAKLVAALSLCATNQFTNEENLAAYMDLAKDLGVTFVQILEPHATGRYFLQDVRLSDDKIALLEKTYQDYNSTKAFKDHPIINYVQYIHRRTGCLGGGNQYLYVNTNGEVQVCPFCNNGTLNALDLEVKEIMEHMSKKHCIPFEMSDI